MPSPPKLDHVLSTSTIQGVPVAVFDQQLLDGVDKPVKAKDRSLTPYRGQSGESRKPRRSHHRTGSLGVPAREQDAPPRVKAPKVRRSMNEHPSLRYIRPVGPEIVSIHQPSCTGLPAAWTSIHDRFIAYLATHAPLDRSGRIPRREENRERWRIEDIARLVMDRFDDLRGVIKTGMIENRLALLDQAGDNDYFKMPYGAYKYEKWGRGV